jgi:hypothetical protein
MRFGAARPRSTASTTTQDAPNTAARVNAYTILARAPAS